MGTEDDEDDAFDDLDQPLPELPDEEGEETLGIEGADELELADLTDGPEEIGLDVETLDAAGDELDLDDDDEDGVSVLDDASLALDGELDEGLDEDGWTEESEGAGAEWDDELDDDEEAPDEDDGGLEGVEDPTLDDFPDAEETTLSIEGDDLSADDVLERVELDLG